MSYSSTCANDYKIVDVVETVTFSAVRSSTTTYSITNAHCADLSRREIAVSNGFFNYLDKKWSLGANQITVSTDTPQQGDTITDASGVIWSIIDVTVDPLTAMYDCVSRKNR